MARPKKWKTVCRMPRVNEFTAGTAPGTPLAFLTMTVEEYEAVRLIDLEDMTQSECAEHLGVSRPTIQLLYENARRKLALFLVGGGRLRIGGGDYRLCTEWPQPCSRAYCERYGMQEDGAYSRRADTYPFMEETDKEEDYAF